MSQKKIVCQYRSWCNGVWSQWNIFEMDTYDSMKAVAENDSSIQVRMHELPLQKDPQEGFINWWASLASPFVEGDDPIRAAEQSWHQSRYETEKEMLEVVAQAIYDQWRFMPGWEPWVPHGSSMRQTDARTLARNYRGK